MQIIGDMTKRKARRFQFRNRKIKKLTVVRLECDNTVRRKQAADSLQGFPICKPALRMTCLRPRIAEIEINPLRKMCGKHTGEIFRVTAQKSDVFKRRIPCLFRSKQNDVAHFLHRKKANLRILPRKRRNKSAFAASDFEMKPLFIRKKCRRLYSCRLVFIEREKQIAACRAARFPVFPFSYPHTYAPYLMYDS